MRRSVVLALALALVLGCTAYAATNIESIDDPPGVPVLLENVVVTFSSPTECYVEKTNRAVGVRVTGNCAGIGVGDKVTVIGALTTIGGERCISNAAVLREGAGTAIAPLAMNNRTLGGARVGAGPEIWDYTAYRSPEGDINWEWDKAGGCSNTGLLVKTWGTVKNTFYSPTTGARWFHIDDGARTTSDFGDTGIIVYSDAPVSKGQFVTVTGVSGTEPALDMPDKLVRVLRTRDAGDVQMQREKPSIYPFSDEFDGEELDWRWNRVYGFVNDGQRSGSTGEVGIESGCLKVHLPSGQWEYSVSPHFVQCIESDWDMEVKLKLEPTCGYEVFQGVGVMLKNHAYAPLPVVNPPTGQDYNWLAAKVAWQTGPEPGVTGVTYTAADTPLEYANQMDPQAEWAWFRVRKRGGTIYGSGSTDGINYTPEYSSECGSRCFVAICAYSLGLFTIPGPVTGYVDYIRITPVSE